MFEPRESDMARVARSETLQKENCKLCALKLNRLHPACCQLAQPIRFPHSSAARKVLRPVYVIAQATARITLVQLGTVVVV